MSNKNEIQYSDSSYPNTSRTTKYNADKTDEKNLEKLSEMSEIYKSEVASTLNNNETNKK